MRATTELECILDQLLRHRLLALLGILPALAIGVGGATGHLTSKPVQRSSATVQVLLEAQGASPVDLAPVAANGLGTRVQLIGALMGTRTARAEVERRAGLAPGDLEILTPTASGVPDLVPIAVYSATAATAKSPYVLTVTGYAASHILRLNVEAPTRVGAIRTVDAARAGLARLVASGRVRGPGLGLAQLGQPTAKSAQAQSNVPFAVAAAIAFFGLWCAGIVVGTGLMGYRASGPRSERSSRIRSSWRAKRRNAGSGTRSVRSSAAATKP